MSPSLRRIILAILVASNAFGLVATSIYMPSIPDMARDLNVPVGQVQLTLTTYLVAFALSMLVMGPLSDRFGRRGVLLGGMAVSIVATALCAVAPNIEVLLIARAIQAVGACAGMALARAMVRDLFDRDGTARAMAALAMGVTLIPVFSPILGGYLHIWFGWRANFVFMTLVGILLFGTIAWKLPETNLNLQNQLGMLRGFATGMSALLRSSRFIGYAIVVAGGGAAFFGFSAAAPVLLIDHFHIPPEQYAYYGVSGTIGFFAGSYLSRRFVLSTGIDKLILYGGGFLVVSGVLMAVMAEVPSGWTILVPLLVMGLGHGLAMPNANAGGVSIHPQLAGTASGLAGFIQTIGACIATVAMALVPHHSAWPIAILFLMTAGVTLYGAMLARRGKT
jgi:MFS transporter, DHA1 family, multidrug resistance protein